jgi:Protein of unknown function (DUF5661)
MRKMERDSAKQFKTATMKAFTTQPNVKLNASTMADATKMMGTFKEEKLKGGLSDNMSLEDIAKKHAYDDSTDSTSKSKIKKMYETLKQELDRGIEIEMEHTKNRNKAQKIAMDHLSEDPKYYTKLKKVESKEDYQKSAKKSFSQDLQSDPDFIEFKKRAKYKDDRNVDFSFGVPNVTGDDPYISKKKWSRPGKEETKEATGSGSSGAFAGPIAFKDSQFLRNSFKETPKLKEGIASGAMGLDKVEAKEATGSGSVGGYSSPAMWAKSTKKKDWGPSRKTQVPGGSFVKVKKKCTKFPYCNQGDINALKITKNESVKEAIKSVSEKFKIGENVIISILENEYGKLNKRVK